LLFNIKTLLLITLLFLSQGAVAQSNPTLKPYKALYNVKFRGLSGGDIEFSLNKQNTDQFVFSSRLLPNFLGSLFTSDQAEDTSMLILDGVDIKPLHFNSEDGSKKTEDDISYIFDWNNNQVKGHYKDQDFIMTVPHGVQDRLSIQLSASLALQTGKEPGKLIMLEKNELQEFMITRQGTEHIRTQAGEFDTVVLKSERAGSSRITRYWYAARLGYLPVRAERTSKGKVDVVMELKSIQFL
jgi:hypothetical protein